VRIKSFQSRTNLGEIRFLQVEASKVNPRVNRGRGSRAITIELGLGKLASKELGNVHRSLNNGPEQVKKKGEISLKKTGRRRKKDLGLPISVR
jgi:hypothetical protein